MLIYLAGPYSSDPKGNTERAAKIAAHLWQQGHVVISPHNNSHAVDELSGHVIPYDTWLKGDLEILERCDVLAIMPGWENSDGTKVEINHALRRGLPIWEVVGFVDDRVPVFTYHERTEFIKIVAGYRWHQRQALNIFIDRQRKYGPGNIAIAGHAGVLTRTQDKIERLKNSIADHADESALDAGYDISNYGLIDVMVLTGEWPKPDPDAERTAIKAQIAELQARLKELSK